MVFEPSDPKSVTLGSKIWPYDTHFDLLFWSLLYTDFWLCEPRVDILNVLNTCYPRIHLLVTAVDIPVKPAIPVVCPEANKLYQIHNVLEDTKNFQ